MKGIADGKARADLVEQTRGLLKALGDVPYETAAKHFAESRITLPKVIYHHARQLLGLEQPMKIPTPRRYFKRRDSAYYKVLHAAQVFEGDFTLAQLIMACWEQFPADFSLQGYHHPCSNKVIASVAGQRGLVARGWLERVAPNVYRVTKEGKQ